MTDLVSFQNQFAAYQTLTQALQDRARRDPQHTALVFLHDDGHESRFSAAEFHAHSAHFAAALDAAGVRQGDLVILALRHSTDLLFAFWGALYLGAIASIFPFLTEKLDPQIYRERVKTLVMNSGARLVITFSEFKDELSALLADASCDVAGIEDLVLQNSAAEGSGSAGRAWPQFDADKIAFLQHSSGTTGLQKGVVLSHRAVLNQIEAYSRAIALRQDDVIVSWLPLYHDMGLIAGFVMPLVAGIPLVLMSPFIWVRDPKLLFRVIHRRHGTLCWLPNFAYNHSARVIRPKDIEGLDLSSMRAFINCSEPVYLHSHEVFLEKFATWGVQAEALSTCYAMAENTFAVTQHPIGRPAGVDWVDQRTLQAQRRAEPASAGAPGATPMVSCGYPIDGTEIRILDEQGQPLGERLVGEIVVRSTCMLSEYYHRPDLTAQAIPDGWYRTGDMGYMAGGQLYVAGRKKDLIIVGGKNIYPQDLEAVANHLPGLAPGRSVAFGLFDERLGSENIVMVCELEDENLPAEQQKALELDLRRRVIQASDVALSDVRLTGRRWLIKTSSGKISRSASREKYIQEFLEGNS